MKKPCKLMIAALVAIFPGCYSATPLKPGAERVNLVKSFDNEASTFVPDPFATKCSLVAKFRNASGDPVAGTDAPDDSGLKNSALDRGADTIYLFVDGSQLIKGTLHNFRTYRNPSYPHFLEAGEAVAQNEFGAIYNIPFYRGEARLYRCKESR